MNATLFLGLSLTLGAPALKDPPKKDPGIVGEWVMESSGVAGNLRPLPGTELIYEFTADGKWLIRRAGKELAAPNRGYKADAKANPPAVDLVSDTARADATRREGIYKVEGDKLTIYMAGVKQPRPASFEAAAEAPNIIYVLKRKKAD
jgi:uncharacterized protein (TIGR03067 family)